MKKLNTLLSVIVLALGTLSFSTIGQSKVIKIDTIRDIDAAYSHKSSDVFHISPDLGSELSKISTEMPSVKALAKFLKNKKALNLTLDLVSGTYYYVFKKYEGSENLSWRARLGKFNQFNSKLINLLEKNDLLASNQQW